MKLKLCLLSFIVAVIAAAPLGARDVTVHVVPNLDTRPAGPETDKPHIDLMIWDKSKNSVYAGFHFLRSDPSVRPSNFTMKDETGAKVLFNLVLTPATDAGLPPDKRGKFYMIKLYPKGSVPKKVSIVLGKPFKLAIAPEDKVDESYFPLIEGDMEPVINYKNSRPQNRLELKAGKSAAVSFKTEYYHEWNEGMESFHIGVNGDTSLQSARDKDYFNNLEAFANVTLGGYFAHNRCLGLFELGTKVESDRGFKIVNETIGAKGSITWGNAFFDFVNTCFVGKLNPNNPWNDAPALPPLFAFGYDYVAQLKRDDIPAYAVGQHRLVARMLWTIPLVRGWEIPNLPFVALKDADQRLNMDLVTDLQGIYDIKADRFSPVVKVDLDFFLKRAGERPPSLDKRGSFVLSFANGEMAPKFQHTSEFLAGFKYKF